jgi:hypothetical protein
VKQHAREFLLVLLVVGGLQALDGCRHVDEKELAYRLDELATLGSEAKTPGPRSPVQVARVESQVAILTSYVKGLAK